jgi:hypothetical protein
MFILVNIFMAYHNYLVSRQLLKYIIVLVMFLYNLAGDTFQWYRRFYSLNTQS